MEKKREAGEKTSPTRNRLIEAAKRLFAHKWYSTVSIAEICREASLSNGIFYRYFPTKEAVFKEILHEILEDIQIVVEPGNEGGIHSKLEGFLERLIKFSSDHPDLISIFREGQYRYFEFERELMRIYWSSIESILGRKISLAEYLIIAGGARFCAIRKAYHGTGAEPSTIMKILRGGLFARFGCDWDRIFNVVARPLPIPLEETTRDRLLRTGKKLFGERGFYDVNIHEITDAADLGVGSFYIYFASKEEFFGMIIDTINAEIRHFISSNIDRSLNRFEEELQGIYLFSFYLSLDRNCYPIVREAEFVLPPKVKEYYDAFEAGYRKNLIPPEGFDPGTVFNYLMGLSHYLGIELVFDESPSNVRNAIREMGEALSRGILFD